MLTDTVLPAIGHTHAFKHEALRTRAVPHEQRLDKAISAHAYQQNINPVQFDPANACFYESSEVAIVREYLACSDIDEVCQGLYFDMLLVSEILALPTPMLDRRKM